MSTSSLSITTHRPSSRHPVFSQNEAFLSPILRDVVCDIFTTPEMASVTIGEEECGRGGLVGELKDGDERAMEYSNHISTKGGNNGEVDDGTFPGAKRPTSGLRLELSNDSAALQLISIESPQPITPSRIPTTVSNGGIVSPSVSGTAVELTETSCMPMPMRRRRYTRPGDAVGVASSSPVSIAKAIPSSLPASSAKRERFGDIRPRSWVFEIPPTAPRYAHRINPGGGSSSIADATRGISSSHGDFFPWNGSHIEDAFTDGVIKNGFFDKSPAGQSDPQVARASLTMVLKHKSGLAYMSHILVSAMGRRRQRGQIAISSTFKPPPRVTLTDTKREIWLKDLANRTISLRKLSRTIPHGIRGRVLLDHCLNKNVPVDRAVWLSKCVGANELRSFRRKGAAVTASPTVAVNAVPVMGGESKYIRDWTASVEQFVGGLANSFEEHDGKAKMEYAIRLATNLYDEQLLERDHYLDWIVTGIESSTPARLPMWLLLAQLAWDDLTQLKKFASRLAQALAGHFIALSNNPDGDIVLPLYSRLGALLACLIKDRPESFIAFNGWRAIKMGLWDLTIEDDNIADTLNAIDLRNMRLEPSTGFYSNTWRQKIVTLLDTTLYSTVPSDMAERCWTSHPDGSAVATMVLDWCTSPHRPGVTKLYIADKILQTWCQTKSLDLTSLILDYIDDRGRNGGMGGYPRIEGPWYRNAGRFLYKLVSGFVQMGQFSVSRYMQWLVARGGLLLVADIAFDGPYATRLLVELPACFLSSPVETMRAGILRRAMFDSNEEQTDVTEALSMVDLVTGLSSSLLSRSRSWPSGLSRIRPGATKTSAFDSLPDGQAPLDALCSRLRLGSRSLQTHVSSWVGRAVTFWVKTETVSFPLDSFHAIRAILEAAVDYPVLAEVIAALTSRADPTILVSCADTVSLHFDIFSALGRLDALFGGLREQLASIVQEQGFSAGIRPALAALAVLAEQAYGSTTTTTQLRSELAELDRGSACDACSPISEHLANLFQHQTHTREDQYGDQRDSHEGPGQLSPDSETDPMHDEIENLLTSGSNLDHLTMDHIFPLIIKRFEASWAGTVHSSAKRPRAQHLALLRSFDPTHFDIRMSQWVLTVRSIAARRHLGDAFPLLIALGCIDIPTILGSASIPASTPPSQQPELHSPPRLSSTSLFGVGTYCQEILQFMVNPFASDSGLLPDEAGRFCTHQRLARDEHGVSLLTLIHHAVVEYSAFLEHQPQLTDMLPLNDPECQSGMLEMLQFLVLRDVGAAMRVLGDIGHDQSSSILMSLIALRLLTSDPTTTPLASHDIFWRQPTAIAFDHLLGLTNDLTRPFCQLKLHLDLARAQTQDVVEGAMGHRLRSLLDELSDAMHRSAVGPDCMEWASLLLYVGNSIAQHVIGRVEARLISLVPSPNAKVKPPMGHDEGNPEHSIPRCQGVEFSSRLLAILESLEVTRSSPCHDFLQLPSMSHEEPSLAACIVEKLVDMWEILSSGGKSRQALYTAVLVHWLPLILRLVVIHFAPNNSRPLTSVFGGGSCNVTGPTLPPVPVVPPSSPFSVPLTLPTAMPSTVPSLSDVHARLLIVLSALMQELETLHGTEDARLAVALAEHVFDIALMFSNDMTEDVRNTCVRLLRRQGSTNLMPVSSLSSACTSDRRLCYIFSHRSSSSSEHLALACRDCNIAQTSARRSAMSVNAVSTITAKRGPGANGGRNTVASTGISMPKKNTVVNRTGRLVPFPLRLWEVLNEPTPNVGLNDTTLSLTLFDATKTS